jgi:hypothetical protein
MIGREKKKGRLENQAVLVLFGCSAVFRLAAPLVKGRVAGVEVLRIEMILRHANGIGNTVNMKCFLI